MPIYAYRCEPCDHEFDKVLRLYEYNQPQTCPTCEGSDTKRLLTTPGFVLQGDGWPGKNIRIQGQMTAKNRRLNSKSKDMPVGHTLVPNVDGEEVGSWADAKKLAADKGKDTTSYDRQVRQETKGAA